MTMIDAIRAGIPFDRMGGLPPKSEPVNPLIIEINYAFPTLNFAHAASGKDHWKDRKKVIDKAENFLINTLIKYRSLGFDAFTLDIRYNSRMDPDNVVYGAKIFIDTCRIMGIVEKDDKRFYKRLTIEPDMTMKHNHYRFKLTKVI